MPSSSDEINTLTRWHSRLKWLLQAGGVLLLLLVISGSLAAILRAARDPIGTQAVLGVTYVCLTAFLLDLLALIGTVSVVTLELLAARRDALSAQQPDASAPSTNLKD